MRRVATAAVVLVAGWLAAACGSSYTRSDFVARADGICTNSLRQARTIPPPATAQLGPALSSYLDQLVPVVRSEYSQLRALPSPPGTSAQHATFVRWLKAVGQQAESYRMLASAAKRGDSDGVASAEAALRANSASALAASLGLRACSSPGATVA